ncbi:DUF1223 domain-containing protein [Phenylobacterium immobile]|uniref:DUF1223 domain-containing protein n=1 Tax=Phenylobacterium immobile TaxID=21 RepID=UPI000A86E47B|nr:DUF1223 domain-containing protein [Phenylobacterium immobile]
MRTAALLLSLLLFTPTLAAARPPVVVELFTAQGCASCGEANAFVGKLADQPGVLALTFPVDYWDYLGWSDTFAKPEFAERQKAYVASFALREPYTPQVVVNGRRQAGGVKTDAVEQLVRAAARSPSDPPDIRFINERRVDVGSARSRLSGEVWMVRYDPREAEVEVRSGDNRGQTITHRNVVHELKRLGAWRGRPTAYRLPPATDAGLRTAVIVQSAKGGRIIGVGEPKS